MIGLFFGGEQFKTMFGNEFGNIEIDATLSEGHEWQADATTNPVEIGADVTDHVIPNNDRISIRGFVTDAPINGIVGNATPTVNGSNRTQAVFDLLKQLIEARLPMTVITKYHIYTDMVLTAVNIPRDRGTGEAIEFNADFLHIRLVSTQTVDVPAGISEKKSAKSDAATGNKTEPAKNQGKVQPGYGGTPKSKSVLLGVFG